MKTSILFLLSYIAATAAFVPSTTSFLKTSSLLRAEEEAVAEDEFKGAQAFSSLTAGVTDVFDIEAIAKILPHVSCRIDNVREDTPFFLSLFLTFLFFIWNMWFYFFLFFFFSMDT